MHTKRIIPCLDVNNGRVVKGINFVNLKDAGDPVAVGAAYDKRLRKLMMQPVRMSLYFWILQHLRIREIS